MTTTKPITSEYKDGKLEITDGDGVITVDREDRIHLRKWA